MGAKNEHALAAFQWGIREWLDTTAHPPAPNPAQLNWALSAFNWPDRHPHPNLRAVYGRETTTARATGWANAPSRASVTFWRLPFPPPTPRRLPVFDIRGVILMTLFMWASGCAAATPTRSISMEEPRVSRGLVYAASTDAAVQELARRFDGELASAPSSLPAVASDPRAEPSGGSTSSAEPPPQSGRLVPLPRLNPTELREVFDSLRLRLSSELGFRPARTNEASVSNLPVAAPGLQSVAVFVRSEAGATRVLRFGVHPFVSRPSELWLEALRRSPDSSIGWEADPVLEHLVTTARAVVEIAKQPKADLGRDDLEFRIIQVNYIDIEGAITGLRGFGIETAENLNKMTYPVPFQRLPLVAPMPSPDAPEMALLGADPAKAAASFELSLSPSMATTLPPDPNLSRASQLLVYFHPAHPEQFARVQQVLNQYIDRPAQQIFIEGLVLEISEAGLKDLGVEWQYREGGAEFNIGSLFPGAAALSSGSMSYDSLRDLEQQWTVRLRALIEDEKAEILSRPSVLTLNNRQATIRVGQEIPIATSSEAGIVKDANRISFNFKYLPTGISLNIRPRIAENANEVSMLVDTVVSSAIPGADLELKSSSGEVLASAPTIATRRVQTYTRIGNNTPFIIGGLVNREFTQVRRKIPLLGDIPYLGTLFRSRSTKSRKQEVIIVLTPHVLPEAQNERAWGRYLPRDDDKFDDVGNALYRASYRIREEDILDLSFLDRSPQLRRYRSLAEKALESDFRLADRAPFSSFAEGRIPGEHILVERMIYEVLKRLSDKDPQWLSKRIAPERVIYFSGRNAGGFDVQFLHQAMSALGDGKSPESFFALQAGKALAMTFHARAEDTELRRLGLQQSPIPELSLVDCPDRKTWGEMLWTLNHPGADGVPRSTILIRDPEDLTRLQRSMLLREVIQLNGGPSRVNRRTFSLGQVLLVPDENPAETRMIDARTAALFVHTEHYYAASLEQIEQSIAALDRALAEPEFQHLR